jgi:alpha/beta superfamily hydrolase
MPRRLESVFLDGPAGRLEALLEEPEHGVPVEAAVVCHPHPLYGGTMHNKVVHRLARGLRRAGTVVLRFQFRGVGRSEGTHDHGRGEVEDARAALDWLRGRHPGLPFTLAGFSFGARVALSLACGGAGARRVIAAGLAANSLDQLEACTLPRIFIQSTNDQYGPRRAIAALFERLAEPKQLIWIEAGDHFFQGALDDFEAAVFRLGAGVERRQAPA